MRLLQLAGPQCTPSTGRTCSPRSGAPRRVAVLCAHRSPGTAEEGLAGPSQCGTVVGSSRRSLLGAAALSSLALLPAGARAEEEAEAAAAPAAGTSGGQQVFFDFTVDGKPAGRVVVEVYKDGKLGAQRFLDLVQGKEGVGYRRSRINLLQDGYIQDAGVKSLSYSGSGIVPIAGGDEIELLEDEQAERRRSHDSAGVVSLVVRNSKDRVSKDKLVAIDGKLVTVTETFGELPNGTAFAITTQPEPDLDETNLPVGRVVSGADVIARLTQLPRVKDNSDSPFFKAGKFSGDKRADVAERAFGKPFARIFIAECGLL